MFFSYKVKTLNFVFPGVKGSSPKKKSDTRDNADIVAHNLYAARGSDYNAMPSPIPTATP